MNKEIEIPDGYEARIEGNKVIIEPKESEDERIRKAIFKALSKKEAHDVILAEHIEISDALAWLEKQKERKPIPFIPKFRVGEKIISTKNYHLTYNILEVGHINELGNQEYKVEIFTDGKPENPRNIKYIECRKMDEWGKLIEQNSAEWSEEDEEIINFICDRLKSLGAEDSSCEIIWLKSLRPQPKATWSEENESFIKTIESALDLMEHYANAGIFVSSKIHTCENIINRIKETRSWLKSLCPQPHWKPSKKQMSDTQMITLRQTPLV